MTYQMMKDLYDSLCGHSTLTATVPSNNIKIGWQNDFEDYPSISIIQVGGRETGQLGFSNTGGLIKEDFGPQIEIYSQASAKQNYDVLSILDNIMISCGYEKLSDTDSWDPDLLAHRKITRWNKTNIFTK